MKNYSSDTLGEEELEELQPTEWEIIDHNATPNVVLRLTSQLCLTQAVATDDQQDLTLWVQNQDRCHAEQYPVVLVHEATQETPIGEWQRKRRFSVAKRSSLRNVRRVIGR